MLSMWNMDYKLNLYFCFHSNTSFTILHFIDTYRVSAVLAVKLQTAAGCCGITFTTLEWRRLYIHPFIPPSTHPSLHLNVHRFPQKHRHSSNINNLNPQLFFTQTGDVIIITEQQQIPQSVFASVSFFSFSIQGRPQQLVFPSQSSLLSSMSKHLNRASDFSSKLFILCRFSNLLISAHSRRRAWHLHLGWVSISICWFSAVVESNYKLYKEVVKIKRPTVEVFQWVCAAAHARTDTDRRVEITSLPSLCVRKTNPDVFKLKLKQQWFIHQK